MHPATFQTSHILWRHGCPREIPPTGEKWQVSTHGGELPRWRADGREIFYVGPDHVLMTVPVTQGTLFRAGVPERLFTNRVSDLKMERRLYAPSADGSHFLVLSTVDDQPL